MNSKPEIKKGLYVITDCGRLTPKELLLSTQCILEAGVAVLQYRDKTENRNKGELAAQLQRLCRKQHTLFIINDDVELAVQLQADGLHLGRDDGDYRRARDKLGKEAVLGVSCYNDLDMALTAQKEGVDYVAFGSVFQTTSKDNTAHASVNFIRSATGKLKIPVAAIGGITPENCTPLIGAGVDLLAVISSVYQSPDPLATVQKFNHLFSRNQPESFPRHELV